MKISRSRIAALLNALRDAGVERLSVTHPCDEIGTLLVIDLGDAEASTVRIRAGRQTYASRHDDVELQYDTAAYEDLPDAHTYCQALTAGGLVDVHNAGEIDSFLERHAYPDLEAGQETTSAARRLHASLDDLLALPDETLVCPGHRGETTDPAPDGTYTARLGELRDREVLSLSREAFIETLHEDVPPRPANHEAIVATNLGQRHPDDDEAFELELGPNNCAAAPSDAD
jgi:hypothetical protein